MGCGTGALRKRTLMTDDKLSRRGVGLFKTHSVVHTHLCALMYDDRGREKLMSCPGGGATTSAPVTPPEQQAFAIPLGGGGYSAADVYRSAAGRAASPHAAADTVSAIRPPAAARSLGQGGGRPVPWCTSSSQIWCWLSSRSHQGCRTPASDTDTWRSSAGRPTVCGLEKCSCRWMTLR